MNGLNRMMRIACLVATGLVLLFDSDKQRAMIFGIYVNVVALSVTTAFDK